MGSIVINGIRVCLLQQQKKQFTNSARRFIACQTIQPHPQLIERAASFQPHPSNYSYPKIIEYV